MTSVCIVMTEHSNVRDPDEYLRHLFTKILTYRLIDNEPWAEANRRAAADTLKEIVDDRKRDVIDGLIDMLFGER